MTPMADRLTLEEERVLRRTILRANEQGWGIAMGLLFGVGLFLATVILVLKGGPNPGPRLGLLRIYFPGYTVTWVGSVIGFIYAFVVGYGIGRTVATVYNRLVEPRT
jgi:hypothetical protein